MGRPSGYSEEIADKVCKAFANSDKGLRKTLEADPELPAFGTVKDWVAKHSSFSDKFAQAKRQQLENMAEDIVDLADRDDLDPNDKRLRVDTRKWLLTKLMHRTYGDKLDVTSGGEKLAVPPHQIDARVQSIIMQARVRKEALLGQLDPDAQRLLE